MGCQRGLEALVPLDREYEDDAPAHAYLDGLRAERTVTDERQRLHRHEFAAGMTNLVHDRDHRVDLRLRHAREDGDAATTQEAPVEPTLVTG